MYRTKSKIIVIMCIALFIMAIGYGAFSTMITITGTANIASEWKVVFTDITQVSKTSGVNIKSTPVASGTTATFDVGLTSPGDKVEYKITIENQGTIDAIIENIKATETGNEAIVFKISNIKIGDVLEGKETTTFNVSIEYNSSVTSQPENLTNSLTISIDYVQYIGQTITPSEPEIERPILLSTAVFRDNTAYADNTSSPYVTASTGINFSAISSDTNGKGLYYTSTNTEGNQPTYYFRGAVTNNNMQFGYYKAGTTINGTTYNVDTPIYWKIIRINEDGSIRLIYNGTSTTATGNDVTIGDTTFNATATDNAYVGYMYGTVGSSTYALTHANNNPSTMKGVIDDWYVNNLNSYSSYLADAGFCNDRSIASSAGLWRDTDTALGYGKNYTYYGAYNRLDTNKKPQFACPNTSNDLFTTSASSKGNKALTNPIGLITADELWYAGAAKADNESFYLYTGYYYWTMSPVYFFSSRVFGWTVSSYGKLGHTNVNGSYDVRPVVNLKSTATLSSELPTGCTEQNGTATCPYIIKTN